MSKQAFLDELRENLIDYEVGDVDEVIEYFDEMIEDKKDSGVDEKVIIENLDSPKEIALILKGKEAKEREVDEVTSEDDDHFTYSTESQNILEVSIELHSDDIIVERAIDERITFVCDKKDERHFRIKNKGDKLKIERNDASQFFHNRGSNVELYLPHSYHGELKIETVSGSIEISDLENIYTKLSAVSGDISVSDAKISELKIETVSGDIEVDDVMGNEIKLEAVSGNIELACAYDYIKSEAVSGDMELEIQGKESEYAIFYSKLFEDYNRRAELKDRKLLKMESVSGNIEYRFTE